MRGAESAHRIVPRDSEFRLKSVIFDVTVLWTIERVTVFPAPIHGEPSALGDGPREPSRSVQYLQVWARP